MEREEAFYAALGQRLILLRTEDGLAQVRLLETLLQQCLRLGPNGFDAAVFVLAAERRVMIASPEDVTYYLHRLESREDLKFSLHALIVSLQPGERSIVH